ncbi:MAG: nucleotidyltransferase family protein, partial [Gemmatimonadetes bacterium]|nr:nucleotidyltransferase family protein [Gemmatimonadota bacterium]
MIAATILSAGTSSRMGCPKALLEYRGRTFLQSILDATEAAGIQRRIVVLGPDSDKILEKHDLRDVTVVYTKQFEAGPIGSIRTAIHEILAQPVEGLLVWPVDMPHVTIATVETLVDGFRRSAAPIAVPVFQGRGGHPVIFGREVFDELLEASDSDGARAVVRAERDRVVRVPVSD